MKVFWETMHSLSSLSMGWFTACPDVTDNDPFYGKHCLIVNHDLTLSYLSYSRRGGCPHVTRELLHTRLQSIGSGTKCVRVSAYRTED
jgi:hypothetical protein